MMWSALGQLAGEALGEVAERQIFARRDQPREIVREPADRRRDRHVVVVEDDDQPVAGRLGIVHRLIGHAGRHRAVADHRDRLAGLVGQLVGDREAQSRRDRGRAVRRAERIVFALAALGEAGEAAAHAQGADAVAPAGDDLVRIGLVADVPDQPVARRVEHIMERDGELDHAEPGAEMAAGHRDRRDRLGAQLVGELAELRRCRACGGRRASRPCREAG